MTAIFFVYSAYVWTAGTEAPQHAAPTEQVMRGQALYQDNNCMACHQFYGLGGYMGPDLTNVVSRMGPDYARAFLIAGTERMPDFGLNQQQMDDIIAFLEFVDTMGVYESPEYEFKWYGTVVAKND
ncbi:MAG: cytochrome c [Xanthomonadales bacterium]|nr:cytochrome c [Xanthomonadales bacterium]